MTSFQKELITAIEEVATSTGLTVSECIRQAIALIKREKKQYKDTYLQQQYKNMFKEWKN
jgi:Na+-translocating ferredoxin:NAD+ oxidoreductase RNF subunit RnfB